MSKVNFTELRELENAARASLSKEDLDTLMKYARVRLLEINDIHGDDRQAESLEIARLFAKAFEMGRLSK